MLTPTPDTTPAPSPPTDLPDPADVTHVTDLVDPWKGLT